MLLRSLLSGRRPMSLCDLRSPGVPCALLAQARYLHNRPFCAAAQASLLPSWARQQLTPDVNHTTGLCANGAVRIGTCAAEQKGLGAFAVRTLPPGLEIGCYAGETITLADMITRYGGGGGDADSPFEYDAANEQAAWVAERERRGVGVTGQYLFNAGQCPRTKRSVLVDAEDPQSGANWTRFINHSVKRANLSVDYEVVARTDDEDAARVGTPVIRFVVSEAIAVGDELLFDYGDGFDIEIMDFVDD